MGGQSGAEHPIFLCYRREDSEPAARRLRSELQAASESFRTFLDTWSIDGGSEWPMRLRKALEAAKVLVVLIGPRWLKTHDEFGRRRLDAAHDWVCSEIQRGLQKEQVERPDFLLLPVLLPDAEGVPTPLPPAEALPEPIARLATLQAIAVEDHSFAKVIERIRGHLAGLPTAPHTPAAPGSAATPTDLDVYRRTVRSAHRELSLIGFPNTEHFQVPIRLEELYVPLDATPDLRRERDRRFESSQDFDDPATTDELGRIQLVDAFRRARRHGDRRGVVILGDPGAGKTTHMRRLALGLVDPEFGPTALDLPADLLPAFLPLRRLAPSDLETRGEALLVRASDGAIDRDTAHHLLHTRGRLLYLFDGLDEVPADLRIATARWIERLRGLDDTSWFAITSRYAGYTDDVSLNEHFLELHLRPLTDRQIDDFVHNWYRLVERTFDPDHADERAPARARDLLERLRVRSLAATRVAEMSGNPLLLTIICLIHRARGQVLPDARLALYDDCLACLLGLWREAKTLGSHFRHDDAARLLQPLALHFHQRGETRLPTGELEPVLATGLANLGRPATPAEFLRAIRDDSGLLTGWSNELYGFLHLGFQEHLAAKEILTRSQDAALSGEKLELLEGLAARFGASWWEEVTLLLLAQCSRALFRRFFELVLRREDFAQHEELLQQCLREAREKDPAPFEALLNRRRPKVTPEQREVAERAIRLIAGRTPRIEVVGALEARDTDRFVHPRCGVELVRIPAGSFLMGSARFEDEQPVHEVRFAQPFWIATTPVTNEQYRRFCEATGHSPPESFKDRALNGAEQPVVTITWNDAKAFCGWAGLELPSEAMWEYACRAGTRTEYWSVDSEKDLARVGWYDENSGGRLHAVAEKETNPWGLFDVHGNVWEWCEDTWGGSFESIPNDTSARVDDSTTLRVVHGGSFLGDAEWCRSASRGGRPPWIRLGELGFRPTSSSLPDSPNP